MMPVPNIDLHRHLDGSLRLQTIIELARQHGIQLPADDAETLRPFVQVTDPRAGLMEFLGHFEYLTAVMVDADACCRIARENVLDAAAEGIAHVELRFSPAFMAERHRMAPEAVVEAVIEGVRQGMDATRTTATLTGILSRTYGVEACQRELDALLPYRDQLVAVDLAGDEAGFPPALFSGQFAQARDAGLQVTVHAGEAAGADSIWSAIRDLGASRIGHGIAAQDDPELMAYLARHRIGLEVSLTSNLHTSVVADYASHPVGQFLEAGIPVALCTDDPGISGIDLRHEYEVAAPAAGLDRAQLFQLREHALEMAFLDERERETLRIRLGQERALLTRPAG